MTADFALVKVKAKKAADICALFRLQGPVAALLTPEQTPAEFLHRLIEHKEWAAAIRLLAYGLPKRETVWWGCVYVRDHLGQVIEPRELAALRAAAHWCVLPDEQTRQASRTFGQAATPRRPPSLLAEAAFMSGGSLSPPGLRPAPPAPTLTARFVSSALLLAAARGKAAELDARYGRIVALGIAIAEGKYSWVH